MVQFDLLADRGILVVTPDGPLEKADFERLAAAIDPHIAANGKLTGIMITAGTFPGWASFEALTAHFNFVVSHHRNIERIAVVTDHAFLKMAPHFAALLVHPKIRTFDANDSDKALAWLETGQ